MIIESVVSAASVLSASCDLHVGRLGKETDQPPRPQPTETPKLSHLTDDAMLNSRNSDNSAK